MLISYVELKFSFPCVTALTSQQSDSYQTKRKYNYRAHYSVPDISIIAIIIVIIIIVSVIITAVINRRVARNNYIIRVITLYNPSEFIH